MSKPYKLTGWKKGKRKAEDFPEYEIDQIIQSYIDAGALQHPVWEEPILAPDPLDDAIIGAYIELRDKHNRKKITDKEIAQWLAENRWPSPKTGKPYTTRYIGERRRRLQAIGFDVGK